MAQSWLHSALTVARSPGPSASSQVQSPRNRAMGCGESAQSSEPVRARSGALGRTPSRAAATGMRVLHRTRAHGTLFPALPRPPGGPLRSPFPSGPRGPEWSPWPGARVGPRHWLSAGQDSGGDYGDQIREPGSPGPGDIDPGHIQGAEESWGPPCNATRNKTQVAERPKPTQQGGLRLSSLTLPLFGARRSVGETGSGATRWG